jgi:RHS repeat-associated protein
LRPLWFNKKSYSILCESGGTIALGNINCNSVTVCGNLAFGGSGAVPSFRYTYTGQEYDSASGLYYYNNRWYDASLGKFISQDPISFSAGDTNLYRYCGNNPVNYTDPSGLCEEGEFRWWNPLTWSSYNSRVDKAAKERADAMDRISRGDFSKADTVKKLPKEAAEVAREGTDVYQLFIQAGIGCAGLGAGGPKEVFDNPADAIGDLQGEARLAGESSTKSQAWRDAGFKTTRYYYDSNGVKHTVFYNKTTKMYSGAHKSSGQ